MELMAYKSPDDKCRDTNRKRLHATQGTINDCLPAGREFLSPGTKNTSNPYLRNMLPKYKRVLLKVSGEALMGDKSFGLDAGVIAAYAQDIKSITELGVQVAIVIGGGNI